MVRRILLIWKNKAECEASNVRHKQKWSNILKQRRLRAEEADAERLRQSGWSVERPRDAVLRGA